MRLRRCARGGFSLLEMLIAMAITAIIVVLLSQVLNSTGALWKRAQRKIDAFREARTALLRMTSEIESTLAVDGLPSLALTGLYSQNDPAGSQGNQQAYLLLAAPNTGLSDVCAAGYFCSWEPELGGYVLRRYFADSDTVARRTRALIDADDIRFLPRQIYPPGRLRENSEILGAFIWNLRFEPLDAEGNPLPAYPQTYADGVLPAALQVSFDAISPRGPARLEGLEADPAFWFLPQSHIYLRQLAPLKQHFSARVALRFARPR